MTDVQGEATIVVVGLWAAERWVAASRAQRLSE